MDIVKGSIRKLYRWDDLNYYVVMDSEPLPNAPNDPPYHVDLSVYPISGWHDRDQKKPFFMTPESDPEPRSVDVDEIDQAEPLFTGSIKWDGCSNLHFEPYDAHCLHFCTKKSAVEFGTLLGRLYDAAAEMMPHWSKEILG